MAVDPQIIHDLAADMGGHWPYPLGVGYEQSGVVGGIPSRRELPVGFWEVILIALAPYLLKMVGWLWRWIFRAKVRRAIREAIRASVGPGQVEVVADGATDAAMAWAAGMNREQMAYVDEKVRAATTPTRKS